MNIYDYNQWENAFSKAVVLKQCMKKKGEKL